MAFESIDWLLFWIKSFVLKEHILEIIFKINSTGITILWAKESVISEQMTKWVKSKRNNIEIGFNIISIESSFWGKNGSKVVSISIESLFSIELIIKKYLYI